MAAEVSKGGSELDRGRGEGCRGKGHTAPVSRKGPELTSPLLSYQCPQIIGYIIYNIELYYKCIIYNVLQINIIQRICICNTNLYIVIQIQIFNINIKI